MHTPGRVHNGAEEKERNEMLQYVAESWHDVIRMPMVTLLLGFRGEGKSALSFHLLDVMAEKYDVPRAVFGLAPEAAELLPDDFIVCHDPKTLPENAAILVDEISVHAYARNSASKSNAVFDFVAAHARKKKQGIILTTHHSRKVDINLVTDVDFLIYKRPSKLQVENDRPAIKGFARQAVTAFEQLKLTFPDDPNVTRKYALMFDFIKDIKGLIPNPLPDYWSDKLSNIVSEPAGNKNTYGNSIELLQTAREIQDERIRQLVMELESEIIRYGDEEAKYLDEIERYRILYDNLLNKYKNCDKKRRELIDWRIHTFESPIYYITDYGCHIKIKGSIHKNGENNIEIINIPRSSLASAGLIMHSRTIEQAVNGALFMKMILPKESIQEVIESWKMNKQL
jgi:hypothetical protein